MYTTALAPAGSNVTGITLQVDDIATIMHRHQGLVFFDYAAAGRLPPGVVQMSPQHDICCPGEHCSFPRAQGRTCRLTWSPPANQAPTRCDAHRVRAQQHTHAVQA